MLIRTSSKPIGQNTTTKPSDKIPIPTRFNLSAFRSKHRQRPNVVALYTIRYIVDINQLWVAGLGG
jgi:hypothetical protein